MNKGNSYITVVLIAAVLSVFVTEAPGASRNWGGSIDSDWFKAGNWTPSGAPASTDDLTIGPYLPLPPTPPRPSTTLPVFVDGGGSISAVSPMGRAYFDDLTIGDTAAGSMDITLGGDVISAVGYVGRQSTGSGAVNVSGGGSIWDNSATLYIGYDGDGELLVQDGGYVSSASSYIMTRLGSSGSATVTGAGSKWITDSLYVGSSAPGTGNLTIADGGLVSSSSGSIGTAALSNGNAQVTGTDSEWSITGGLSLGSHGAGKLTVGGGGKVRADGMLYLGDGGLLGGGGTVDLNSGGFIVADVVSLSSGGVFNIATGSTLRTNRMSGFGNSVTAGRLQLGNVRGATAGAHTVSAGQTFDVNHDFIVGYDAPAAFTQTGGAVTADYEILGYSSTGTYNQSDGTHQIATYLHLAEGFGTVGTYTLSGGSLTVGTEEIVGRGNGPGSFVQTGGTHTVGSDLYLGQLAGPFGGGTYNLSGAPSQLTATNEYIGYENTGVFTQSDGTHQVQDVLYLGHQAGGTGTYNFSEGTLIVKTEYVGYNGTGIFNQTGGSHHVLGGETLYLGYAAGSSGAYTLDGGNLTTSEVKIAEEGSGTFIQNGGIHSVTGKMYVGHVNDAPEIGRYELHGGTLYVSLNEYVGDYGAGEFLQTDGAHTVLGDLYVGTYDATDCTGSYDMTGGTLEVRGIETVSAGAPGVFTQSGGTHTVQDDLIVGGGSTGMGRGDGIYNLSATGILNSNADVYIGTGDSEMAVIGVGLFDQSGGAHTVAGSLYVGHGRRTGLYNGTYNLSDGTLDVGDHIYVGYEGVGKFNQSGSGQSTTGQLVVGYDADALGVCNLDGGTMTASISETVGYYGTGEFNQTDGVNDAGVSLVLGGGGGSVGTYNLDGGGGVVG